MSEVVERVARAIAKAQGFDGYCSEMYLALARAAIEAMIEPTPGMLAAAKAKAAWCGMRHDGSDHWSAMITEALK